MLDLLLPLVGVFVEALLYTYFIVNCPYAPRACLIIPNKVEGARWGWWVEGGGMEGGGMEGGGVEGEGVLEGEGVVVGGGGVGVG